MKMIKQPTIPPMPKQPTFDARDTQYNLPIGTDCISRQAAIDALCNDYCGGHQDCKYYPNCENLRSVQKLPSAQPERAGGTWIKTARWGRVYYCDQCRNYLDFDGVNAGRGSTNYCPNCGADMREKGENSESN